MCDYVQAYAWYSKAYAISGSLEHKSGLDTLKSKMQPADIERAHSFDAGTSVSTKRSPAR
ncbi:Sel1 domain protein repeat-containing protein (fragment) [Nitrospira japonica]|uniref:Sel1 domain protein repeat-containing protein n=1 Tax=Nitrospira japonica TaxID=1325564 RepID=A0A1W1I0N9_9BACT